MEILVLIIFIICMSSISNRYNKCKKIDEKTYEKVDTKMDSINYNNDDNIWLNNFQFNDYYNNDDCNCNCDDYSSDFRNDCCGDMGMDSSFDCSCGCD